MTAALIVFCLVVIGQATALTFIALRLSGNQQQLLNAALAKNGTEYRTFERETRETPHERAARQIEGMGDQLPEGLNGVV